MSVQQTGYQRSLATNLRRALYQRRLDEAETLLARLRNEAPLAVETRGFELELAFLTGRLTEARKLAQELAKAHPESARIRYLTGRIAYASKDYAAAVAAFEQCRRMHHHWRSSRWLGKALTQSGDYERAEPLLLELQAGHHVVALDLAWLYERRGDPDLAAEHVEAHLQRHPDDKFAQQQRLRIASRRAPVEALQEEIEALEALDEAPPPAMLPVYVEQLLTSAQGDKARSFVQDHCDDWPGQVQVAVGWACYHNFAQDLAYDLFAQALPQETGNFKLLNTLEAVARHCQREADLIERYGQLASGEPRLYGRIKRLESSINPAPK